MRTIRRPPPPRQKVEDINTEFRYQTMDVEAFIPQKLKLVPQPEPKPSPKVLAAPNRFVYERDKIVWDKKANLWKLVKESEAANYE